MPSLPPLQLSLHAHTSHTAHCAPHAQNFYGVTLGAILGHVLCTTIAVLSGRALATVLSIRTVTFFGGISFILFAAASLIYRE